MELILRSTHPDTFDQLLHMPTVPVTAFGLHLQSTFDEMYEIMYDHGGIGIAANQIGSILRMAIVQIDPFEQPYEMVNPEIFLRGPKKVLVKEGCLSLPGQQFTVERRETVAVKYQDMFGTRHTAMVSGLAAYAMQHEVDHLNGITLEKSGVPCG